jgi:MscS family membrane protein
MPTTLPSSLTITPELVLPLDLQIPLGGLLLALLSWLGLEVVGRRCRPRSLLRGLLLTSRLSVALTCLLAGLGWWLGLLLDPVVINLERDGHEVRELLVALGVAWTLLRWHSELRSNRERYAAEILPRLNEQDRHFLFDVLQKLISIAIWAIVIVELMRLVGLSAAVLVTAGGFGAAAVGFGAQGIVSNSLSGLSLYVNRPFIVDDFIEIPSEQLSGTVEEIGWFYTRLRSRDLHQITGDQQHGGRQPARVDRIQRQLRRPAAHPDDRGRAGAAAGQPPRRGPAEDPGRALHRLRRERPQPAPALPQHGPQHGRGLGPAAGAAARHRHGGGAPRRLHALPHPNPVHSQPAHTSSG